MIISVLIAGIIALFSAMSVAELSAYLPEEGGTYAYAQKLISPFAGFIAGWIWVFSNIFVGAAVSLGFAHYFATLFPALPVKGIAVIICLIFIVINYIGLKESTILNNLLVTFKVLILLFFIAFGLGFFRSTNLTPFAPSGISGILGGAALIFFAYTGFARVTIMAEEVTKTRGLLFPAQSTSLSLSQRCSTSLSVSLPWDLSVHLRSRSQDLPLPMQSGLLAVLLQFLSSPLGQ